MSDLTGELTTSLRINLDNAVAEAQMVVTIFDGIELTGLPKPFVTVEDLFEVGSVTAAGHRDYDQEYSFQVGVFATSLTERYEVQKSVKQALQNPDGLTLYTLTGIATDSTFVCDVSGLTKIANSANEDQTNEHHGYFDVTIRLLTTYGSEEFSQ